MNIHEAAAQGYEVAADSYERGRPEYPSEAVQYLVGALGIREGSAVLDLGAGTGKFTKLLAPSRARLLAVEPVKAMREKLADKMPCAPAHCAEAAWKRHLDKHVYLLPPASATARDR